VNGTIEIGGPKQFHLDELVRLDLAARHDPRVVITDLHSGYYGVVVLPDQGARLGEAHFEDWLYAESLTSNSLWDTAAH
jgi:hypothetical protein